MDKKRCRSIGRYISQIQRTGATYISKELSKYDIGYGQFMFLIELYRKDGIKQEELSERLSIDKGTTARAIKKLEDNEFLTRIVDKDDKRAYKIYLTDKALGIKDDIFHVVKGWNMKLTINLSEDEKESLMYLLEKICNN